MPRASPTTCQYLCRTVPYQTIKDGSPVTTVTFLCMENILDIGLHDSAAILSYPKEAEEGERQEYQSSIFYMRLHSSNRHPYKQSATRNPVIPRAFPTSAIRKVRDLYHEFHQKSSGRIVPYHDTHIMCSWVGNHADGMLSTVKCH